MPPTFQWLFWAHSKKNPKPPLHMPDTKWIFPVFTVSQGSDTPDSLYSGPSTTLYSNKMELRSYCTLVACL